MKKNIFPIIILSATIISTSCSSDKKKTINELPTITVSINQVNDNNNSSYISASGKIEAENSANISTRMMGYVTSIRVKMGQKVQKGQLLATISSTDIEAQKRQAEAGVAQAQAAYNSAKQDFDRFSTLFQKKSATPKEMDDMSTRFNMAKAGLDAAKQIRDAAAAQMAYSNITAPFTGKITNTFIKEGEMAQPGMPILSLEASGNLQAVVMVSENEIAQIKNGMIVNINVKSLNKNLKGRVTEVSNSARNTGGQYLVKINLIQPPSEVLSGMFVDATFPIEKKTNSNTDSRIFIPTEALIKNGQMQGVYVVNEHNKALLRWLKLGKNSENQIEVLSGLSAGEKYVLSSQGRLFNGATVQIK